MRVKLSKPKQGLPGLDLLQAKIKKESAEHILNLAKIALETAVEHTPKWSGSATEGWRFSFTGENILSTNPPMFMDIPKFEEGIHDPKAAAFNRLLVNKELNRIRLGVYSKVRAGKDVKLSLYNTQTYSQKWLSDKSSMVVLLRIVNQDYYTFSEICAEVRISARMAKFGKW